MGIDNFRKIFAPFATLRETRKERKTRKMKKGTTNHQPSCPDDSVLRRNSKDFVGDKRRTQECTDGSQKRIVISGREKVLTATESDRDVMSLDTRQAATPRTKGNLQKMQRQSTKKRENVFDRFERRVEQAHNRQEPFALPCSIDFLSLILPHEPVFREADVGRGTPSIAENSDIGGENCAMSVMSGHTVLAKDRVQETICSSLNIGNFFNSRMRPSSDLPPVSNQHDTPVNVDFVMESTEKELATFSNRCIKSGNLRDALDIYESILGHYRNTHKQDHGLIISTIHNLSVVHTWNGNYDRAMTYCNESLKLKRVKYGDKHKELVSSLCELAILHYAKENFNKSLGALREALLIETSNTKPSKRGQSRIGGILNNIACIHYSMGKLSSSLTTFKECLNFQREMMGSAIGPEVDYVLFNMSIVLTNAAIVTSKMGDNVKAASLMEEGLIVQQSVLPDNHRIVTSVTKSLGYLDGSERGPGDIGPNGLQIEITAIPTPEERSKRFKFHEDLNSYCAEMLSLGPADKDFSSKERVQLHLNIDNLPEALLEEGRSKQHCSWVDVDKQDEEINFFEASQIAATCVQVSQMLMFSFGSAFVIFHISLMYICFSKVMYQKLSEFSRKCDVDTEQNVET